MQTYWSILERVKGSSLRLTRMDDDIYEHLQRDFPDFDPAVTINEDEMKSKAGKERWRNFMMVYEKKVDDYNFGTMMRSDPKFEYGREETIFGGCMMTTLRRESGRSELTIQSAEDAVLCCRDCAVCSSHGLYAIRSADADSP